VDLGVYVVASNTGAGLPNITVTATMPNASRVGPANGCYHQPQRRHHIALTVNCSLGGSASSGLDYIPIVNP